MKNLCLALAVLLLSANTNALAKTVITVSTWGSPKHGVNTIIWPTWKKWIEKVTDGRVTLKVVYGLAPPNAQLDTVIDGVADASWIFHGFYRGRFTTTSLPEIPIFKEVSSQNLTVAYYRTYDKYLKKADEYKGLIVMTLGVHGPGCVLSKKPVTDLSDLAGQRMRLTSDIQTEIAKKLEIVPVALPPTSVYEAASQGIISGAFLTLESLKSFRLAEVFPNTLMFPGGLYRGSFSIVVNRGKWQQISPADQHAIMAVSGEKLSALFGQMWDKVDEEGLVFAKSKGNTLTKASAEMIAEVQKITANMPAQWVQQNTNKGFDAKAAIDYFYQQLPQ